ncbi:MAG: hypothetical protein KGL39_12955 [Patescibacteria group bacterium]|nr:hypothetical protein [Patescibacteria group bacterium]
MPSIISNQTYFRLASTVVTKKYSNTTKKVGETYSEILNEIPADKRAFIQIQETTGMGVMSQMIDGQAPALDSPKELNAFTATFLKYGLGYEYTEDAEDDDAPNFLAQCSSDLAYSRIVTEEQLYWNIFNQAFNSGVTGTDGVALCNSAHPAAAAAGITQSNTASNLALAPESLFSARLSFKALLDQRGLPITRNPKWVLVPLELENTAGEILGTDDYPYSDENRINMEASKRNRIQVKASRYLTSATAWFLLAGKGEPGTDCHGLFVSHKYKDRQKTWVEPKYSIFGHKAYFRSIWGFYTWYGTWGTQGS